MGNGSYCSLVTDGQTDVCYQVHYLHRRKKGNIFNLSFGEKMMPFFQWHCNTAPNKGTVLWTITIGAIPCFSQVLKGAVGTTLCQNEAEVLNNNFFKKVLSTRVPYNGKIALRALMILLPHSSRGSQQLLLSRTGYCQWEQAHDNLIPSSHNYHSLIIIRTPSINAQCWSIAIKIIITLVEHQP